MNYKSRPSHFFPPQKIVKYTAFVSFVQKTKTAQHSLHLTCLVEHQQQQQCSYDEHWQLHVHLFADYPMWL